jgi:hypothetical protein
MTQVINMSVAQLQQPISLSRGPGALATPQPSCVLPAPSAPPSGCVAHAPSAPPALTDYQPALNEFGRMVGSATQGNFGVEDKGRLDGMVKAYMARTDVTPAQKEAMQKIASEFDATFASSGAGKTENIKGRRNRKAQAKNAGGDGHGIKSTDWASFLGKVGGLLSQVPGGQKAGEALKDFASRFASAYDAGDKMFGRDDMNRLQSQPNGAFNALAQQSMRGERMAAADFGRFLGNMTLPTSAPAPAPVFLAPSAPVAASPVPSNVGQHQPVAAHASGANSMAFNFVNNGTINFAPPSFHAFNLDVASLKA